MKLSSVVFLKGKISGVYKIVKFGNFKDFGSMFEYDLWSVSAVLIFHEIFCMDLPVAFFSTPLVLCFVRLRS